MWHTGAMLDGSSWLATHYTLCQFQIELAHSYLLDSDFHSLRTASEAAWTKNTFPHTSGFTLGHRSDVMSADPEHEGFVGT